jgi:hypothetical protein
LPPNYVDSVQSLRSLLAFEVNRITLIQRSKTFLLNGGIVNEDIFSRGTLDETISFGPVKPLHNTTFCHNLPLVPESFSGSRSIHANSDKKPYAEKEV